MRVVIDSNVWISALVFGGSPRRVFEAVVSKGHSLALSEEIVTEVRRVLHAKFPDFSLGFEALLTVVAPRIHYVTLGTLQVDVCRDPDDNRVLETAVIGGADFIISGDNDLLALGQYAGISICSPAETLKAGPESAAYTL